MKLFDKRSEEIYSLNIYIHIYSWNIACRSSRREKECVNCITFLNLVIFNQVEL